MTYNLKIVLAYFVSQGLPEPSTEFAFAPGRRWRFDFAWVMPHYKLALEVEGGIWQKDSGTKGRGAHNRGARMIKTWERDNFAAEIRHGAWRILRCQPKDLLTLKTVEMIRRCL